MTWQDRFNGRILYLISQITQRSGRFQISGQEHVAGLLADGAPIVLAAWHGMTMMLVGYFAAYLDLSRIVLILPDDWRGQTLSVFAQKLGAQPFPMNLKGDAGMAAARQLAQLVRKVKQGNHCYITPDGPDGPGYVIKPGVAYIARKANAVILPVGAYARHGYRLNRWDQYMIPYPFSRISIHVGEPLTVTPDAALTAVTEHLTDQLHRVTAQAAANYYEK